MNRYWWILLLCGAMTAWTVAWADDDQPDVEKQMQMLELRQRQLDVQEREMELDHRQKVRALELKKQEMELQRPAPGREAPWRRHGMIGHYAGFMALCAFINILLAIWVFQDIRKRNAASGIWIVVTLVAGFFGALLYALVRLGDKQS